MDQSNPPLTLANVILVNDNRTPRDFVVESLRLILGKSEREARQIEGAAGWLGRAMCGCYPTAVAQAFVEQAARHASAAGHALAYALEPLWTADDAAQPACSFCGKPADDVRTLTAGKNAFICDGCVIAGAATLASDMSGRQFNFVYEILERHFAGWSKEQIVSSARSFPERMRADLQRAAEALFASRALRTIAIHGGYDYEQTTIATLLQQDRNARTIGRCAIRTSMSAPKSPSNVWRAPCGCCEQTIRRTSSSWCDSATCEVTRTSTSRLPRPRPGRARS